MITGVMAGKYRIDFFFIHKRFGKNDLQKIHIKLGNYCQKKLVYPIVEEPGESTANQPAFLVTEPVTLPQSKRRAVAAQKIW
jgi:hypothetical protein